MQKLVWQNANGDSIDLTSGNYGITQWEGFSNTSLNIQSQQVPFQDGAVFLDALLNQRELSVTLKMQDNGNLEERYRMRRELIHILNPKLGEGYLIYTNDFISKRIKCVAQVPLFETHNSDTRGTPKASLSWTACEPYWEDLEETSVTLSKGVTSVITNDGDAETPIKLEINNCINPVFSVGEKSIALDGNYATPINISTEFGNKQITQRQYKQDFLSGGDFRCSATNGQIIVFGGEQICVMDKNGNIKCSNYIFNSGEYLENIIFHKSLFIALVEKTNASYILTSKDGMDWQKIEIGYTLRDICTNGKIIIVVGANGVILSSSDDGKTWGLQTSGTTATFISATYGLDNFIVISSATMLKSSDAITWTNLGVTMSGMRSVNNCNEKIMVCVSNGIYSSLDLSSWSQELSASSSNLNYCIYGSRAYVAVGNGGRIYVKTINSSWTSITVQNVSVALNNVIYFNGLYIIFGIRGTIVKSKNATNWNLYSAIANNTTESNFTYQDMAYGLGKYIIVGAYINKIFKSTDKKIWVSVAIVPQYLWCIKFINNKFVACGNGVIVYSNNGDDWTTVTVSGIQFNGVCYAKINNSDLYIAVGKNSQNKGIIYTSTNLTTWNPATIPSDMAELRAVDFDGTHIIAVGLQGQILISNDGIEFSPKHIYNTGYTSIFYSGNEWIIVGNNIIGISEDGIYQWQLQFVNEPLFRIAKGNGVYIACGYNGVLLESFDLIHWNKLNKNNLQDYKGIVFNGDEFITLTDGGFIQKITQTEENIISQLTNYSDMSIKLDVGENQVLIDCDDGGESVTLKYRQKYLGV